MSPLIPDAPNLYLLFLDHSGWKFNIFIALLKEQCLNLLISSIVFSVLYFTEFY